MNGIIEGLNVLDTQRGHGLGMLNEYGANDSRSRYQLAYYQGMKDMLEIVSGCVVCVYDDHHRAIKTDGQGEALPDEEQPYNEGQPLLFATRRDRNGNRKFLKVYTDSRRTERTYNEWASRSDFVEIGSADFERLADILSANGYYTERGVG